MQFNRKDNENGGFFADQAANIAKLIGGVLADFRQKFDQIGLKVGLDEIQENYATMLDMLILREEEEKNCDYLGGEFRIAIVDENTYDCAYTFYFEDSPENFHELSAKTPALPLDGLKEDLRAELQTEQVICFELGEPSEESVKKYQESKAEAIEENSEENL